MVCSLSWLGLGIGMGLGLGLGPGPGQGQGLGLGLGPGPGPGPGPRVKDLRFGSPPLLVHLGVGVELRLAAFARVERRLQHDAHE